MDSRLRSAVWSKRKLNGGGQFGEEESVTMLGYLRGGERAGWGREVVKLLVVVWVQRLGVYLGYIW